MSAFVINPYAFTKNLVVNGDFSDVTGLTSNVANWWVRGIPAGWTAAAATANTSDFVVRLKDGRYYANLGILSREPAAGLILFAQNIPALVTGGTVQLTFFASNPFNSNAWAVGYVILNASTGTWLANASTFNIPASQTLNLSLQTSVGAGVPLRIGFWKGAAAQTPAITDVSLKIV